MQMLFHLNRAAFGFRKYLGAAFQYFQSREKRNQQL